MDIRSAGTTPPLLRLRGLSKSYGSVTALHPLDLDVAPGDFCAVLGPSGCGKSTLLRMVGGFVAPTTGTIEINGEDVTRLGPDKRATNMVFQSYGLFPHLNVAGNVGFGLRLARRSDAEIAARVGEALELVRLDRFSASAVQELSGGQQQRVALARALVMRPLVLLLDEPLAALDLKLRHAMQDELRRIHREIGGTFILVTHDQNEAFALASRVVVMNAGRVEQVGSPDDVYLCPSSLFVAGFVGEANVLPGWREAGRIILEAGATIASEGRDGEVTLIIRPERVVFGEHHPLRLSGVVVDLVFLGNAISVEVAVEAGGRMVVRDTDLSRRTGLRRGDRVTLSWSAADHRVLEAQG